MAIKITWLGHSAFSLDINGAIVLIDPFLTGNPLAAADPAQIPADFILLTHGHGDHVGDAVSIARRTNAPVVGNFEVCNWLNAQGVEQLHGQNLGGNFDYPFGRLKMVRADHSSSMPDGSYGGLASGYVLTVDNKRLYFAGDTALFSDMSLIGDMDIDLAAIPIGDYFTMGIDDSIDSLKWIQPKRVFPIHYNTFPVIQQDAAHWALRVNNETKAQAVVVDPGSSFTV